MSTRPDLAVHPSPGTLAKPGTSASIPFVRANAFAPFIDFLDTIGSPVARLLRQARIPAGSMEDPEALLPIVLGYRFIELAARQEQIEDLGIVIGQRASSFDLGAYGSALQRVSTVYEYLQLGVRLIGEHSSGTRFWLKPESGGLRLNQYLSGCPGRGRCIADLYTLSLTINMLRRFAGADWSPGEVRLLAGDEALLGDRQFFGEAALITGQRHTSFTIPRALLRLPVHCPQLGAAKVEDTVLAAGPPMPSGFRSSVEQVITLLLTEGYPSVQVVAEAAGLSLRTLQRRLAESGESYSDLVSASRLRLAKAWLTGSDMAISEIARSLGYNEASNFARAFRRETGVSPVAYRRGHAADADHES